MCICLLHASFNGISAYNLQRGIGVPPLKTCTGSNKGQISYNSAYMHTKPKLCGFVRVKGGFHTSRLIVNSCGHRLTKKYFTSLYHALVQLNL